MISQDQLKSDVLYDENTGIFSRKITGKVLGRLNKQGYTHIYVLGKTYSAHRLAWLYVNGGFEFNCVDHLNGDKSDNRISNLRCVKSSTNMKNKVKYKNNKTGISGVHFETSRGKYRARVGFGKNSIDLGYFTDLELAKKAVIEARECNGYTNRHGG